MSESLVALMMALGDDELIIGHRHSEWTGYAPHIEEDVAFSSIAQDEIGHAAGFYSLVAELTGGEADHLALGRGPDEYGHAVLCERPNNEWAYTLARHWLYDTADAIRLEALADTAHKSLAQLVAKIRREERYHMLHADTWLRRVAHGPVEGRMKLIDAVAAAYPDALGLFEPIELENDAVKEGWLPVPSAEQLRRFVDHASAALDDLGLPSDKTGVTHQTAEFVASSSGDLIATDPEPIAPAAVAAGGGGGRAGRHTPDFEALWDVMTKHYREHPGASW